MLNACDAPLFSHHNDPRNYGIKAKKSPKPAKSMAKKKKGKDKNGDDLPEDFAACPFCDSEDNTS